MTTARTIARSVMRAMQPLPENIRPIVEEVLVKALEIHGAIEALRPILDHRENIVVTKGHISADPPLSEAELALLAEMMSDGRLPVIRSFVGLTRALLERMKDKPKAWTESA